MDLEFKSTNAAGPILIVGDGDFSFSVAFCKRYDTLFTTSNLESYGEMEYKYPNFADNVQFLQSHGVKVMTGVDATKLTDHFSGHLFSRIVFNFPHVGGKSNIKKNRQLLDDFFISASQCLETSGRILITLCKGQGGTDADSPKRLWADSWQVTAKASNSGLILTAVNPFEGADLFDDYLSTGFRSQNKRFHTDRALVHTFIHCYPLPPLISTSPDIHSKPKYSSSVIEALCSILCRAWNLSLVRVDFKNKLEQNSAVSVAEDLSIYSAVAELHCEQTEDKCDTVILIDGKYQLIIRGSDVFVSNVLLSDENQAVGQLKDTTMFIDVISLLLYVTGIADARYFLSECLHPLKFQTNIEEGKTLVSCYMQPPASIYPPQYRFDISFWLPDDGFYTVDKFFALVLHTGGETLPVKQIGLQDIYTGKCPHVQTTGSDIRVSHCYSITYQSLTHSLSFKQAYSFYQCMRNLCPEILNVILR